MCRGEPTVSEHFKEAQGSSRARETRTKMGPSLLSGLSRGQRLTLRLGALALVNYGVYRMYVKAIERAKELQVHGKFHTEGELNYDAIVESSYKNYVKRSTKE